MKLKVVFAVATLVMVTYAQNPVGAAQNTCPIDVISATPAETYSSIAQHVLRITYRNTSDKTIVAARFGALYFDPLDDPDASYTAYITTQELKPGKQTVSEWRIWSDVYDRADAWVSKIKFADGTKWKDDGSLNCNAGVGGLVAKGGLLTFQQKIKEVDRTNQNNQK